VDHGLRLESASEAELVGRACSRLSVPHETLGVSVSSGNLQSEARKARYAALGEWAIRHGISAIATAHHADDQAETLVMRLNRGSGVSGLAGVRARGTTPGGTLPLIRPLLDWRREELATIAPLSGENPVQDPSNSNERFDRVRVRQQLGGCDWLSTAALAQSAAHLAEADDALGWAADREWEEQVRLDGDVFLYGPVAPRIIRIRVIWRVLERFGGSARGSEMARLADALEDGGAATLAGVQARSVDGIWTFTRERARRS